MKSFLFFSSAMVLSLSTQSAFGAQVVLETGGVYMNGRDAVYCQGLSQHQRPASASQFVSAIKRDCLQEKIGNAINQIIGQTGVDAYVKTINSCRPSVPLGLCYPEVTQRDGSCVKVAMESLDLGSTMNLTQEQKRSIETACNQITYSCSLSLDQR